MHPGSAITGATVAVTTRCDLQCSYCYQADRPGCDADWEDLRHALDWLVRHAGTNLSVAFTGGEPLLALPLLRRALVHLRRRAPDSLRLALQVITNGQQLTSDLFAELTDLGVEVRLSADGVEAAQHARGAATFAVLDRLLDDLAQSQPKAFADRLTVVTTLTPAGVPHLADGARYFLDKGVRNHSVGPVMTACPGWDDPDRAALDAQFARIATFSREQHARTGMVSFGLLRRYEPDLPHANGSAPCTAASGNCVAIDVAGQVSACALFSPSTVRANELLDPTLSERLCWGRPGTAEFAARRRGHHAVVEAAAEFQVLPSASAHDPRCRECAARDSCRICPFVASQQARLTGRLGQPAFLCALAVVAAKYRRQMPALPLPPEVMVRPEVIKVLMHRWQTDDHLHR